MLKTGVRLFLWLALLTGLVYPLFMTAVAQLVWRDKANGSLLIHEGKAIGSSLIGQKFQSDRYFWPRPSAVDYNPLPSGGSNLAPTSARLKQEVEKRLERLLQAHPGTDASEIPSDMLYASGSGLDPHITVESALFQVDRVVKARGVDLSLGRETCEALILQLTEQKRWGFIGIRCINVLKLNEALDAAF